MKLYGYFRSSAAYRVRIALEWKGLAYEYAPVHLTRNGGEQHGPEFRARNPQGLVPALEIDGAMLLQSQAIVEALEEMHPDPPLLPADLNGRARVRALAAIVACDVHPLNNLRVLRRLEHTLGADEEARSAWYRHWVAEGLSALEALLAGSEATGTFCHGDRPTMADVFLVPQVFNARRFACDLTPYPTIVRIDTACRALPAFDRARPEVQPDAPSTPD